MCNDFCGKLNFSLAMTRVAHCSSRIMASRMVFHLQTSHGWRGSGQGLALAPSCPGSEWPINLVCADTGGGGCECFAGCLLCEQLIWVQKPRVDFHGVIKTLRNLASKDRAVTGFLYPADIGEPAAVVLIPLLYCLWHHIDLGLSEASIPLPLGLRLSGTSQKRSLLTALQLLSMGNELSALLTEIQLWLGSSWEIMSDQCDAVCATIQSANETGEKIFKWIIYLMN